MNAELARGNVLETNSCDRRERDRNSIFFFFFHYTYFSIIPPLTLTLILSLFPSLLSLLQLQKKDRNSIFSLLLLRSIYSIYYLSTYSLSLCVSVCLCVYLSHTNYHSVIRCLCEMNGVFPSAKPSTATLQHQHVATESKNI
jgi:hypothetical protein